MADRRVPPPMPPLFEPERDAFSRHAETPQLADLASARAPAPPANPFKDPLAAELEAAADKEDVYNRLRLFKRDRLSEIEKLETAPFENRRAIVNRLSEVADALIGAAYEYTAAGMPKDFGKPSYLSSYKQTCPAELAVIGMGRHGAGEMNYESDLDLIFVFSHVGETCGPRTVSNSEYFSKFAQRFVNLLSLPTGAGRCYEIDLELRPSGNAGPVVTSLDHFLDHQMNRAAEWERLALLRARVVTVTPEFGAPLAAHLDKLSFGRPLPENFFATMAAIRERVLREKAKDAPGRMDLKLGRGTLMDLTFLLQGVQLKNQTVFPELRRRGLFELFDALRPANFFSAADFKELEEAHRLLLTLESRLHLLKKRPERVLVFASEEAEQIAAGLRLGGTKELQERLSGLSLKIREAYEKLYAA